MYLVSNIEIVHYREHLAERIRNLHRRRYLPVEVPAVDFNGKGVRIGLAKMRLHTDSLINEIEHGTVEPEVLCCVHKLNETRNGKRELFEELNVQLSEAGGGDPTNNRLQVSANTSEPNPMKVRKYGVCSD